MCVIRLSKALFDSTTPTRDNPRPGSLRFSPATFVRVCGYHGVFSPTAARTFSSTACSRTVRITELTSHNSGL